MIVLCCDAPGCPARTTAADHVRLNSSGQLQAPSPWFVVGNLVACKPAHIIEAQHAPADGRRDLS